MTWETPKTDWDVDDVPSNDDANRWEGNIDHLFGDNSTNIASANNLNIGNSIFLILTGNTNVLYISTTGRKKGSRITLQSDQGITLNHLEGTPPANYAEMYINVPGVGPGDKTLGTSGIELATFVYNGTYWVFE